MMRQITEAEKLERILMRLAHEIVERNSGTEDVVLLGIQTNGVAVAERMQREIERIEGVRVPCGSLDVTLFRDDLLRGGELRQKLTVIDFSVQGKRVVLCDDVLYTGRTVRAAVSAILDYGRPQCIQFLAVADRGRHQLPFSADYVGKNVFAEREERVVVSLGGETGEGIWLQSRCGTDADGHLPGKQE